MGAGAAACAVCCAVPVLSLPLFPGLGATAVAFICSGAWVAVVVAAVAATIIRPHRKKRQNDRCPPAGGPIDLELTPTGLGTTGDRTGQDDVG